jgi:ArsR family transcriptional regulator
MTISPEQLIQALADQTRLRSVLLLQQEGELCVCELMYALDVIQPKISRHLALLRDLGLVSSRRQGQWIYYRLTPELPGWAVDVIEAVQQGAKDSLPFSSDLNNLSRMANRPGSACIA